MVLNVRKFGENNRIVTFLSKEKGVFDAILYGGPKSKLRSLVSPAHCGTLWIYKDKQKNSNKITDFEVLKFHSEIRENPYKNWCVSFASELIIKTEACGEFERCWKLANGFFDGICTSSEDECRIGVLRFIWRYLDLMGLQADCKCCNSCDEGLDTNGIFSVAENGFLCSECAQTLNISENSHNCNGIFFLSQEAIAFLQTITFLSPKQARNCPLHYSSTRQLHDFLFFLIDHASEHKLRSLEFESSLL